MHLLYQQSLYKEFGIRVEKNISKHPLSIGYQIVRDQPIHSIYTVCFMANTVQYNSTQNTPSFPSSPSPVDIVYKQLLRYQDQLHGI